MDEDTPPWILWSIDDIEDEICSIVAEVTEKPPGAVYLNSPLDEGMGFDSLALVQSQVAIEERFGIVMPDIDETSVAQLHTVKDLVQPVAERIRGGAEDG